MLTSWWCLSNVVVSHLAPSPSTSRGGRCSWQLASLQGASRFAPATLPCYLAVLAAQLLILGDVVWQHCQ